MCALKVSVILDNKTPPRWIVNTLELIDQLDNVGLERIIVHDRQLPTHASRKSKPSLSHKLGQKLLFGYINRPRFATDVLKPTPLPDHLSHLIKPAAQTNHPAGDVKSRPKSSPESSPESSIDSAEASTNILLHFANDDLATPIKPSLGTWTVQHDKLSQHVERSVLKRRSLLWVHLWNRLSQSSEPVHVASHALPMQSFSIDDLTQSAFGCLPVLITSRLNWASRGLDPQQHESRQLADTIKNTQAFEPDYATPPLTGIAYLASAFSLLCKQCKQRIKDKTHIEQWQLGFVKNNGHASDYAVNDFTALEPPKNAIWADPMTMVVDKQTHVFFEELDINENKGRIVTAVLTQNGFESPPVTALDEPHHLSYPLVFAHDNSLYMIPETAANGAVSLYTAQRFPDQWKHDRDLLSNVNYADSTLLFHNGLWWMFTNGISHEAVDERDTLLIFYCRDFLNDNWQPHPLNPVVTGVDRARMAGQIYEKNGALFRPSQYGAIRYGYGLNVAKIHTLSTEHYEETLISRTMPTDQDSWMGCHTASHGEEFTVVDRITHLKKTS